MPVCITFERRRQNQSGPHGVTAPMLLQNGCSLSNVRKAVHGVRAISNESAQFHDSSSCAQDN